MTARDDEPDEETAKVTKRVVLKREIVLVLPAGGGTPPDKLLEAWKALGGKGVPQEGEAWVVVGEHPGATKSKAIRAHTGEPGSPDTKPGDFKAPSLRGWRGGERMVAPPKPLFQAQPLEDY